MMASNSGWRDIMASGTAAMAQTQSEIASMDYTPVAVADAPIAAGDAVAARAIVVRFRQTNAVVDRHPVIELDLLVLADRGVPRPVTIRSALSLAQVPRVQRGASIPVILSRSDPTRATVDWAELA